MTESEAIKILRLAIPTDRDDAEVTAQAFLNKAVARFLRMQGVDFNKVKETFSFTADKGDYELGVDLFSGYLDVTGVQELWLTDRPGSEIEIVPLDEFNYHKRGRTSTGRPTHATVHSKTNILEVAPTPDQDYAAWVYLTVRLSDFNDIPHLYHDVVVDEALASIKAALAVGPQMAQIKAESGREEIKDDTKIPWEGSDIEAESPLSGDNGRIVRIDSGNLTGN